MSQTAYLSTPDPEFVAFLGGKPLPSFLPEDVLFHGAPLDWVAHRAAGWARIQNMLANAPDKISPSLLKTIECFVPTDDGAQIPAEAYIPERNADEPLGYQFPLFYWLHGGGWCLGDHRHDRLRLQNLAVTRRIAILSIGYRLAPEHPFPTGVYDAYAGLKWAAENAPSLNADLAKGFVVAGQSAGSNIAAAILQLALDDPDPHVSAAFRAGGKYAITGQLHQIPALVHPLGVPEQFTDELLSHTQNADDNVLTPEYIAVLLKCYAAPPSDPRVSPLLSLLHPSSSSVARLPPAYIQVAGGDLVRDDGFAYARLLRAAGVPARLDAYPGVPHGWFLFAPKIAASVKFFADTHVGLAWLLDGAPPQESE